MAGPRAVIRPPPPRLVRSSPSPRVKDSGPRFDTTTTGRSDTPSTVPTSCGHDGRVRVVAVPDKLRGTATAAEAAAAIGHAAWEAGWECNELPVADGGEGTLEAL